MKTVDYNGEGKWSAAGIADAYSHYADRHRVADRFDLSPKKHAEGDTTWIYPVMEKVIDGVAAGDPACAELAIDFIQEDLEFPFGMTLKVRAARKLRQTELDEYQRARIRQRVVRMLLSGNTPREIHEYSKLLRKVGFADQWEKIEANVNRSDPKVMKIYEYLKGHI